MGKPVDRSNRFLAPETSFEKAFPKLKAVFIESVEIGKGTEFSIGAPWREKPQYGPKYRLNGGLIRCSNPLCNRGGYQVDFEVSDMCREKLISKEFRGACHGDEGSPKGRRQGRRCLNHLRYRITLEYWSEHAPST